MLARHAQALKGRPSKPEAERLIQLNARVTRGQANELDRRALERGQSTGDYLRSLLDRLFAHKNERGEGPALL